jgi:hypothetical protein
MAPEGVSSTLSNPKSLRLEQRIRMTLEQIFCEVIKGGALVSSICRGYIVSNSNVHTYNLFFMEHVIGDQ